MRTHDDFAEVRKGRAANRWIQVILALTLAVGLNLLSGVPAVRVRADLTTDQRHSLARESVNLVAEVGRRAPDNTGTPWVTIVQLEAGENEDHRTAEKRASRLLNAIELEVAQTGRSWLRAVRAGSSRNSPILTELAARHGPIPPEAGLIVACGTRQRILSFPELAERNDTGQLEEGMMSALVQATDDRPLICYLTRGHGELSAEDASADRGLSQLARQLRLANVEVRPLTLGVAGGIPRDASMLLIAGPVTAFSPAEAELIRAYLYDRNGRVLLLLDAGRAHGLEPVLESWAIFSPDAEVREPDPSRRLPDGDIALRNLDAKLHPVAQVLATLDLPLVAGRLRPVGFDLGSAQDSTLGVWQMIYSSAEAWGEADPRREPARFDPARDQPGPICIAVAAERRTGLASATGTEGGRLVVIGSSDLAANARLDRGGNRAFLLQSILWLGGRERVVSIPPRPSYEFALTATTSQLISLGWRCALVPLAIAALGLAVSTWRRRT